MRPCGAKHHSLSQIYKRSLSTSKQYRTLWSRQRRDGSVEQICSLPSLAAYHLYNATQHGIPADRCARDPRYFDVIPCGALAAAECQAVRRSPRHTPWLSIYCDPRWSMFDGREPELMRCVTASLHPPKVSMGRLPP